jgi:hypothetical protein
MYICICSRSSQLSFFSLAKYPRSFIVFVAAIEYKEGPVGWLTGGAPRPGGRSRALRQLSYTPSWRRQAVEAAAMLGKAEERWNMCIGLGSVNCWRTQRTRKIANVHLITLMKDKLRKSFSSFFFHSLFLFQQVEPSSDFNFRPFYDNLVCLPVFS